MKHPKAFGFSLITVALLVACQSTVSLGSDPNGDGAGGTGGDDAGQGGGGEAGVCTLALAVCPPDAPPDHQDCSLGCGQSPLQCNYDCAHGQGYVTFATCDGHTWSVSRSLVACAVYGSDSGSTGCTTNADCPSGEVCGFPGADTCSAVGSCVNPGPPCATPPLPGCACDGTELALGCNGFPNGYAPKPLLHTGACTDSGLSGGCVTDADCANGDRCGFPVASKCSAVGSCVNPGPPCAAPPLPGCACDGTELALGCNGFPNGYAPKPLLHTGACTGDAG
jgi:hypothetical protein